MLASSEHRLSDGHVPLARALVGGCEPGEPAVVRVRHESAAHRGLESAQSFPGTLFLIQCFCRKVKPQTGVLAGAFFPCAFSYLTNETDGSFFLNVGWLILTHTLCSPRHILAGRCIR